MSFGLEKLALCYQPNRLVDIFFSFGVLNEASLSFGHGAAPSRYFCLLLKEVLL